MKRTRYGWLWVTLLAFLLGRDVSEASLIGDLVTVEILDTLSGSTDPASTDVVTVLEGAVEIFCPGPFDFCTSFVTLDGDSVDVEASSIRLDLAEGPFGVSDFIGYRFSSLDWLDAPGRIDGFILSSNILGIDDSDVSFGDHELSINFAGATVPAGGGFALVELITVHVPEPHTLGLLALGLVGVRLCGRRRRSR